MRWCAARKREVEVGERIGGNVKSPTQNELR